MAAALESIAPSAGLDVTVFCGGRAVETPPMNQNVVFSQKCSLARESMQRDPTDPEHGPTLSKICHFRGLTSVSIKKWYTVNL